MSENKKKLPQVTAKLSRYFTTIPAAQIEDAKKEASAVFAAKKVFDAEIAAAAKAREEAILRRANEQSAGGAAATFEPDLEDVDVTLTDNQDDNLVINGVTVAIVDLPVPDGPSITIIIYIPKLFKGYKKNINLEKNITKEL